MSCLHVPLALIFLIIMFKWGDWRNWKHYYPTILFLVTGDLFYNQLTENNELWMYTSPIFTHEFIGLLWSVSIYPAIVMVFLSHLPRTTWKTILYVLSFVIIFSFTEYIIYIFEQINYYNGWKFIYSPLVYIALFTILIIHHRKPLLAWILYFTIAYSTLHIFDLPLKIFQ